MSGPRVAKYGAPRESGGARKLRSAKYGSTATSAEPAGDPPPKKKREELPRDYGPAHLGGTEQARDIVRQAAKGLSDSGHATAIGATELVGADNAADRLRRSREENRAVYGEAETGMGTVAGVGSRVAGDLAQFLVPGTLLGRAASAASTAAKARGAARTAEAASRIAKPTTRVGEAARDFASAAPLTAAFAAAGPEESTVGAVGALAGSEKLKRFAEEHPRGRVLADMAIDAATAGAASRLIPKKELAKRAKDLELLKPKATAPEQASKDFPYDPTELHEWEKPGYQAKLNESKAGGAEQPTFFPGDGSRVKTRFRVVEADDLTPSHDPFTFDRQPEERYPGEIQGRAYHGKRGQGAREQVTIQSQQLDPVQLLDPAFSVTAGPPVITPAGVAVAGNQRIMLLQRAAKLHPERFDLYRQALAERAAAFGVSADEIGNMRSPVLVREIDDPAIDVADIGALKKLNAASDAPQGKTKDVLSDAATRVDQLRASGRALEHLRTTLPPESTIRQYLETSDGGAFVRELIADGVISQGEKPRYLDVGSGAVTQEGKTLIERLMYAAAVGDPDVIERATDASLRKIEHALPAVLRSADSPGYEIGPMLREALDVLAAARANSMTVLDLARSIDMFGRSIPERAMQLAEFIEGKPKADVSEAFRRYASGAVDAKSAGESADMFGYVPPTPEQLFARVFGEPDEAVTIAALRNPPRRSRMASYAKQPRYITWAIDRLRNARGATEAEEAARKLVESVQQIGVADRLPPDIGQWYSRALGIVNRGAKFSAAEMPGLTARTVDELGAPSSAAPDDDTLDLFGERPAAPKKPLPLGADEIDEIDGQGSLFALEPSARSPLQPGYKLASETMLPDVKAKAGAPPAGSPPITAPRRREITKDLYKALGLPMTSGWRLRIRNALGVYNSRQGVIRLKTANDIETTSHEVGHHMHSVFFGTTDKGALSGKPLAPWNDELMDLAMEVNPETASRVEGWAEFWRRYLTNPEAAERKAPALFRYVQDRLEKEMPDHATALHTFRDRYKLWQEAGPDARVESHISRQEDPRHFSIRDTWQRVRTNVLDDLNPIEVMVREIEKASPDLKEVAEQIPRLARLVRGSAGVAEHFIEHGTLDFTTLRKTGKALREILAPVNARLDEFTRYAVARRASELRARGIESGLLTDDIVDVVSRGDRDEAFKTAFAELQRYNRSLLKYLRKAGVISPETYRKILDNNQDYVPFYRVRDDEKSAGKIGSGQFGHLFNPVHRIKGSGRDIIDPIESIIKNTYVYADLVARQQVSTALSAMEKEQGVGLWIRQIDAPQKPVKFRIEELRKQLGGVLGGEIADGITEAMADEIMMIMRPGDYFGKPNVISVLKGDKRVWYEVDEDVFNALQGLDREQVGSFWRMLGKPASWLRAGATLSPEFIARNPIRDQLMAFVQSEHGFVPFWDLGKGIFHLIKRDDAYWSWKKAGGSRAALASLDRNSLRDEVERVARAKGKIPNVVKNPFELLRVMSAALEDGTRIGEFLRGVDVEGTSKEGLQASAAGAREVSIDFARHGAQTAALRGMAAFWNARLQGYDRLFRAFKKHPVKAAAATFAGVTLPSMLLYYVNRDDPDYWEIPQWQRDLFWCVKVGGHFWRIPKPFELGIVFGTIPERLLEWMDSNDAEGVRTAVKDTVAREVTSTFLPIPTVLMPLMENWANKSMFLQRPLVPDRLEKVEPELQAGQHTSELAQGLGRFLNYSPSKIDNLIYGYTGGLGRTLIGGAESAADKVGLGDDTPPVGKRVGESVPGVKGFAVQDPGQQSESVERFYREWEKIQRAQSTVALLEKQGQTERADAYATKHEAEIALHKDFGSIADELAELRAQITSITRDPDMTPKQKQAEISTIGRSMMELARDAIGRRYPSQR